MDVTQKEWYRAAAGTVRLDGWMRVFEKTDRIMSGKRVRVRASNTPPPNMGKVAGWSDGENVFFNAEKVKEMLATTDPVDAVLRLKGLNYHELSHILFTPRAQDELPKQILAKQKSSGDFRWWYAFNALEDQRIETAFSHMYPSSARYFESIILQWVLTEGKVEGAILLHGRKFLSPRLRVQSRLAFEAKYPGDLFQRFADVIDEYQTLVLPAHSANGVLLVGKFRALMLEMQKANDDQPLPDLPTPDNGVGDDQGAGAQHDTDTVARAGNVARRDAQDAAGANAEAQQEADADDAEAAEELAEERAQRAAEKAAQQEQDGQDGDDGEADAPGAQPGEAADDGAAGSGDAADDDSDDGGSSTGEADVDGDDGEGEDGQASSKADGGKADDEDADGPDGGGAGNQSAPTLDDVIDAMRQVMEEAGLDLDDIRDDPEILDDVADALDQVKAAQQGQHNPEGNTKHTDLGRQMPVADETFAQSRTYRLLQKIRQQVEPGMERRTTSGRIDPRRVLTRQPHEVDIFKQWQEGHEDDTSFEVVLLLDVSSSMQHYKLSRSAAGAAWAVKRSFDRLDAACTVLTYDTSHDVLFTATEKVGANFPVPISGGGTNPESALREAQMIFHRSQAANKVLVAVTDGEWWCNDEQDVLPLLKQMHGAGVTSALLGLKEAVAKHGRHGFTVAADMESPRDMVKIVTDLVAKVLKRRLAQV